MKFRGKASALPLALMVVMTLLIAFALFLCPRKAIAANDSALSAAQAVLANGATRATALQIQSNLQTQAVVGNLRIDQGKINKVGKQAKKSQACLCFAYAYMDTITTGVVHYWNNYTSRLSEADAYADRNAPSMTFYRLTSQQAALKTAYDGLSAGKPVIVYVNQSNGGQHWVLLVGFKNVSNPNSLSTSNFLMLDPVNGASSSPEDFSKRGYSIRLDSSTKNVRVSNKAVPLDSVNPIPTVKDPSIVPTDVLGGKKIKLVDNQGGATIRYTLDGKTNPSSTYGSVYDGNWINDDWAIMGVRAIAYKSGMNPSKVVGLTNYTSKTQTPNIIQNNASDGVKIELTCGTKNATIFYTTDGSNPTFDLQSGTSSGKKYTGAIQVTQNCTIKALAVAMGATRSDIATKSIVCPVPAVPEPKASADKIAQGDAAKITWNRDAIASSYQVTLYKDGEAVESKDVQYPEAAFILSDTASYEVGVKAINATGSSDESQKASIEAIAPSTVRFVSKYTDEAGEEVFTIDNEQKVKYGYAATEPSETPQRKGYSFKGWDGSFANVTGDVDIIAKWQINKYIVQFYSADGKTSLSRQTIEYNKSAEAPSPGETPAGYVFSGWSVTNAADDSARDFRKVDSNMTLRAVFAWADEELPVVAQITNAERTASGNYTVNVKLSNYPKATTTALLRVALKTKNDKLVQTSRETIDLEAAGSAEKAVTLKYSGDYIASKAEAEVVGLDGNYRTGGAYSEVATADVVSMDDFYFTDWSEWSTEQVDASDTVEVEQAIQYRFHDKQTTTSTASSLDGWTREGDPVTTYGAWSGNSSTTSKPVASDTLQITGQSTKYTYYRYCNYYDNQWQQDSKAYGSSSVYHEVTLGSAMTACANRFADKGGKAWDLHGPYGSCDHKRSGQSFWWTKSTVTTYTYQTRSKTVTYGYCKWGDWSEWSFDQAAASSTREVEKRTVYRYRTKKPGQISGTEDASGEKYSISGKLATGTDLSGKQATIMVYNSTNTDPNEDQIQYIGQTVLGADNAYAFEFTPRSEPSVESGDFIVSLGVKGATGLVNISTIEAPRAKYKVTYQYADADGKVIVLDTQDVAQGSDAKAPEAPSREGCLFLGWSGSATRVENDMVLNALFSPRTCTVAWVDHENSDVFLETCEYGKTLTAPEESPAAEGYTFKGWDVLIDGAAPKVTENMVVTAVYEPVKHTVIFATADGGIFEKKEVEHGKAADLPEETPVADGMEFVAWGTTSEAPWWNVTEDMIVKPYFAYENTVSSPYSTVELAEGYVSAKGYKAYLGSSTENAKIYYTTDGSVPSAAVAPGLGTQALMAVQDLLGTQDDEAESAANTSKLYDPEEGITVTEPTKICAIAVADEMNDSSIAEFDVNVTATNDIANADAGVAEAPFFYGEAVEPGVMVWLGDDILTFGEDYTIEYANNAAAGTGFATVTGKGAYIGTQTIEFDIIEAPQDAEIGEGGESGDGGNTPAGGDSPSGSDTATPPGSTSVGAADGAIAKVAGSSYKVVSNAASTVSYQRAPKSKKSVTIPAKVKIKGKTYTVVGIAKNAFKGTKAKTVTVKTAKLTKKTVKGCFKGAKKLKTVKVKVGAKKQNKKVVKKYKKIFKKSNSGKSVAVK